METSPQGVSTARSPHALRSASAFLYLSTFFAGRAVRATPRPLALPSCLRGVQPVRSCTVVASAF